MYHENNKDKLYQQVLCNYTILVNVAKFSVKFTQQSNSYGFLIKLFEWLILLFAITIKCKSKNTHVISSLNYICNDVKYAL